MLWILAGLALGIVLGQGRFRELGAAFDGLVIILVDYVAQILAAGVDLLSTVSMLAGPLEVLAIAISVMAPGLLVALLLVLVRAGQVGRRVLAGLIVAGGALSFAFLPVLPAVILLVAALVVASTTRLVTGPIFTLLVVALGTLTAYRYIVMLIDADDPVLNSAAAQLAVMIPGLDEGLARIVLAFFAISPFFTTAATLLRGPKTAD